MSVAVYSPGLCARDAKSVTCWVKIKNRIKKKKQAKAFPSAWTHTLPLVLAPSPAQRQHRPIQQQRSAQRSCAVAGLELGAIGLRSSPAAP